MENKIKIGLAGIGGILKIENDFLNFQHPYGKNFRVLVSDIKTVTVDVVGFGKGTLKIIGHGAELAKTEMPIPWANKCQDWILSKIKNN